MSEFDRKQAALWIDDAELIRRMGEKIARAVSPEAFAKEMGWAPKRVRRLAKCLGACRILGNRMALMPDDIKTILEATKPCHSKSIDAREATSSTIAERLPDIGYESRREQRIAKQRRELRPRPKLGSGNVVSIKRP